MMLLRFFRWNAMRIPGCLAALFLSFSLWAREPSRTGVVPGDTGIVIGQITISGNKVTRPSVILREMMFRQGDSLLGKDFAKLLLASRENIFNTPVSYTHLTLPTNREV